MDRHERGPRPIRADVRQPALGGHAIRPRMSGASTSFECMICKRTAKKAKTLAPQRCGGSAALRWACMADAHAKQGCLTAHGNLRALSGDVLWCIKCGAYATTVARGLTRMCPGRWQGDRENPRRQQLASLRRNVHPYEKRPLPSPILECDLFRAVGPADARAIEELAEVQRGPRARARAVEGAASPSGRPLASDPSSLPAAKRMRASDHSSLQRPAQATHPASGEPATPRERLAAVRQRVLMRAAALA